MLICGIVCEYNPFHNGHLHQIQEIRRLLGKDTAIVCLMSGNYVQRGMPAIYDKSIRASAAILSGADLVIELPLLYSLSSAEGFASGAVGILSKFCDFLCFGTETGEQDTLIETAQALLSDDFPVKLHAHLDQGLSFPAARQNALSELSGSSDLLTHPNDILAVEYTKAILKQQSSLKILPIKRSGDYHDIEADTANPSATSLRQLIVNHEPIAEYIPESIGALFESASIHTLNKGHIAILSRLRTMSEESFQDLPYGSEGLWRKLMHASQTQSSLDEIIGHTKSKRYTRTRIDRMIMCAFLGITQNDFLNMEVYGRVLAFNNQGRYLLNKARETLFLPNAGEKTGLPYETLERRSNSLYGLFCETSPEPPDFEEKRRVCYFP